MEKKLNIKNAYSSHRIFILGIILIIAAALFLILFFLKGETTIDNSSMGVTKSESLVCTNEGILYPFFTYDETAQRTMKVNVVFQNDELSSLSLIYTSYYDDMDKIGKSININQVNMNKIFIDDGLAFDALGLYFSKMSNGVQFGLYAKANEINNISKKYFLLDSYDDGLAREEIMQKYISKGFNCTIFN